MHRASLLTSLDHYPRSAFGLESPEAAMLARTIEFVRREPACFHRTCLEGHVTGSAWVVDARYESVVLLFHAKLERWLQPGGHADGDPDIARVAAREAREETGLTSLKLGRPAIFDVDTHLIPARGAEPEHWHYDVRFLFTAERAETPVASSESRRVQWIPLTEVVAFTAQESVARMTRKTHGLRAQGTAAGTVSTPHPLPA